MTNVVPQAFSAPSYPLDTAIARKLVMASCFWQHADAPCDTAFDEAVFVLGAFDGLHQGHRSLVAAALADAHDRGLPCVAVTFDPDPSVLLQPDSPQSQLLSVADRKRGLVALGLDAVITLPFDKQLAALSPEAFVSDRLTAIARPAAVHVGSNFHFGQYGAGNVQVLRQLGISYGFDVVESPLVEVCEARVSSTRIRALLGQEGRLAQANELLCRCHFVRGTVEHGRGEGASFGFPTANVRCSARACMPSQGVYAGFVVVGDKAWPAAINVGAPPSFSGPDQLFLEANLIGFTGNLYDADASVVFVEWLRPSRRFDALEELERVVLGNIAWVRENLGEGEVSLS